MENELSDLQLLAAVEEMEKYIQELSPSPPAPLWCSEDELSDEELRQSVEMVEENMLPHLTYHDVDDYSSELQASSLTSETAEDVLKSRIDFSPLPPLHLSPTMLTGYDVIVIIISSSTLSSDTIEDESSSESLSIDSFSDVEPN